MRHPLSLFVIALMTATTVVMGAAIIAHAPVQAQPGSEAEQVALQIYETLPDFPRENQYVHRKKKQIVESNTLISRLLRYHRAKGRSPQFRLDWKLTMADYLNLNERITPRNYPGTQTLKENPLAGDQAVIQGLTRVERNALIQAIVETYRMPDALSSRAQRSVPVAPTIPASPNASASGTAMGRLTP